MLIFGTRGKQIQVALSESQHLLLIYRYFHLFWAVRLAYGRRFALATWTQDGWATRGLSDDEARHVLGGRPLPEPTPWDRFSLIGALAVVVLLVLVAAVTS